MEKVRLVWALTSIAVAARHSKWIVDEAVTGAVHRGSDAGHVPRGMRRKLENLTAEYDMTWAGKVEESGQRPSCRRCLRMYIRWWRREYCKDSGDSKECLACVGRLARVLLPGIPVVLNG